MLLAERNFRNEINALVDNKLSDSYDVYERLDIQDFDSVELSNAIYWLIALEDINILEAFESDRFVSSVLSLLKSDSNEDKIDFADMILEELIKYFAPSISSTIESAQAEWISEYELSNQGI